MIRIAVLADIHANIPALQAVIQDLAQQELDEILIGGDLVGRGPQGSAVTHMIAEKGWACIRGNHEDYVLNFSRGDYPEEWSIAEEWSAARWMGQEIDAASTAFLDQLPMSITSSLCPSLRLVHGTPASYKKGLGTWTSPEDLQTAFAQVEEPLLVCAHTHRPFLHTFASRGDTAPSMGHEMIVNVGSVGMPFNGDWRAQYAIFSTEDQRHWEVEFRQVPYDREQIYRIYQETGFLEQGGVTASLLLIELQQARPYLVPFFQWVSFDPTHTPDLAGLQRFMEIYDPLNPRALLPQEPISHPESKD